MYRAIVDKILTHFYVLCSFREKQPFQNHYSDSATVLTRVDDQKFPVNGIWVFAHGARMIEVLQCAAQRVLPRAIAFDLYAEGKQCAQVVMITCCF